MTTVSNDPNESISRFLDRYCGLGVAPGYAVMLRGPWGSGKTWFVEKFKNHLSEAGKRVLYVSLFGVSKTSDITDQLFAQIHPKLGNPKVQKVWGIAKGFLKGSIKIDLDGDGQDDGSLQIGIPEIEKWAATEGSVLIFDDLERSGMKLEDVLGYINQFVEHDGYRVLLVANENAETLSTGTAFQTIKEKVVGRTFQIEPNATKALTHFLDEVRARSAHPVLIQHRDQILKIFHRATYGNLRQLRQAVFDFTDLWDCLDHKKIGNKSEFIERLLDDGFTLSIEYRAGAISVSDMHKLGAMDWSKYLDKKEGESDGKPPTAKELALKRHGLDAEPILALPPSTYAEFFGRGSLSEEAARDALSNSHYLANESTASWRRLWYLRSLSDDEFLLLRDDVLTKLISLGYSDHGEIFHAAALMLSLSKRGLTKESVKQMENRIQKAIRQFFSNGSLLPTTKTQLSEITRYMSAYGLGFIEESSTEFRNFVSFYSHQHGLARSKWLKEKVQQWLPMLSTNTSKWAQHLLRSSEEECWFAEEPALAHISAKDFCTHLRGLQTPDLIQIQTAIGERYSHPNAYSKWLLQELPFLRKSRILLSRRPIAGGSSARLSSYSSIVWLLPTIDKAILAVENIETQQDLSDKSI